VPKSARIISTPLLTTVAFLLALSITFIPADAGSEPIGYGCGTQEVFEKEYLKMYNADPKACSTEGPCDIASMRDGWIPDPEQPITYIRLVVHILAEDDGSNPITTEEETWGHIDNLNVNYLPYRIQFVGEIDQVNASQWRGLGESQVDQLKNATAWDPTSYLNVWATNVDFNYSFATFPWSGDVLGPTGGIIMGHFHWSSTPSSTLSHEVGHCLGLWHTFHGVDEVSPCGDCGEYPGSPNPDTRGDFCADTPGTPTVTACGSSSDNSSCGDQLPYGYTMPENYMAYTPSSCQTMFSTQQSGRMLCWIDDVMDGWVVPFQTSADATFGPAPLTVQFEAVTPKTPTGWDWDFDDGDISSDQSPLHVFDIPGNRTVTIDLHTAGGSYQEVHENWIAAYADTMRTVDVTGAVGEPVRVDVNVHNYLDIDEIILPFNWGEGPLEVQYDSSSTTGLRTDYFDIKSQLNYDVFGKRATLYLSSGSQPYLEPGNAPVVSIWFTVNGGSGECPIRLASYAAWSPEFDTYNGRYPAYTEDGSISLGCCVPPSVGDLDQSGETLPFNVSGIDLSILIDGLFIGLDWSSVCMQEADMDLSGQPGPTSTDIDGIDLSYMINALFIDLEPLNPCP